MFTDVEDNFAEARFYINAMVVFKEEIRWLMMFKIGWDGSCFVMGLCNMDFLFVKASSLTCSVDFTK